MLARCAETVSILYAMTIGADDACVRIDLWSILSAFGAFMILVVIAQHFARKLWAMVFQTAPAFSDERDSAADRPVIDDSNYTNSAIRSTKR